MERGSTNFADATQITKFFYEVTLKVATLVTEYASGKPVVGKESIPQGSSHDPGCLQSVNYCLGVSGEMVAYDQYIHVFPILGISSSLRNLYIPIPTDMWPGWGKAFHDGGMP